MRFQKTSLVTSVTLVALLMLAGCSSTTTATTSNDKPAASSAGQSKTQAPKKTKKSGPDGTRAHPYPIGTEVKSDDWAVTINKVTFNANDAVAKANQFNDKADAGSQFILINATTKYVGDDKDGSMPALVTIEYVTPTGNTVDATKKLVVAPDALDTMSTLYKGASATGNIALEVPSANAQAGVLAVSPGMMADKVFVAVK